MDLWKSKLLVVLLLALSFVAVIFLFLISRWDTTERIVPQGTRGLPVPPSQSPAPDYSYTNIIPGEKSQKLQINGIIESIGNDWLVIVAKEQRYTLSTTSESYVECRQEYIKDVNGTQIPAYSIFLDLTRYILAIENTGKAMVEKGQLFYFSDVKARIEARKHGLAVIDARETKNKGNTLFFLIVYGCK